MPETRDFRTLRQRYADAVVGVLDSWARNPGDEGQFIGRMVHAVKGVRDEELEQLRDRMEADRLKHRAERDIWKECDEKQWQQIRQAQAANARVREVHARDDSNPHGPWCGTCMAAWPCSTWRALDGEEPDRG